MRLIYLLSNVPDESLYIIYLPVAGGAYRIQKVDFTFDRGINGSRLSMKDLQSSFRHDEGGHCEDIFIHATIHPSTFSLSSRSSTPCTKQTEKKCKLRERYSRILRSEEKKLPPIFFRLLDPMRMK